MLLLNWLNRLRAVALPRRGPPRGPLSDKTMAAAASLLQSLQSLERARQLSDVAAQRVAESAASLLQQKADAAVAYAHSARGHGKAPTSRDVAEIEQLQMFYDVAQALCEARASGEGVESDLLELGREYHARQKPSPHRRAGGPSAASKKAIPPARPASAPASRRRSGGGGGSRSGRKSSSSPSGGSPKQQASFSPSPTSIVVDDGRTAVPPVELGVLVLPELRQLLPGRLGLEALASSRALQADHINFVARTLRGLPGAAPAIAARADRNSAGMAVTALSFASLPNGVPEDDTVGKCCCAAVRTDGSGVGDGGVAVVMGAGEANVLLDTLVLRVPDVREDGSTPGRCWVTLPPFRVPRAHFSVCAILDGKIVVAGGVNASGELLDSVEMYDPSTRRWVNLQPLLVPRACCAALPLATGGMVVLGGALNQDAPHNPAAAPLSQAEIDSQPPFAELYDVVLGKWLPLPPIPGLNGRPLHGIGAAAVGTCIVVGGGSLSDGGDEWYLWRGCAVLPLDADDSPHHCQWHCRAGQPIPDHGDQLEPLSAFSTWTPPDAELGVHEWRRKHERGGQPPLSSPSRATPTKKGRLVDYLEVN